MNNRERLVDCAKRYRKAFDDQTSALFALETARERALHTRMKSKPGLYRDEYGSAEHKAAYAEAHHELAIAEKAYALCTETADCHGEELRHWAYLAAGEDR